MNTSVVKEIAQEIEEKRIQENWSENETIQNFVNKVKEAGVSLQGWFRVDSKIYSEAGSESWFWMIRRVRNNLHRYQ